MGLYIRHGWYHYKKTIEGKAYYRTLKLKRGQEALLSYRLKQLENEVVAQHFGIPHEPTELTTFEEYLEKYRDQKKYKKSLQSDLIRLEIIKEYWGDMPLRAIGKPHVTKLEEELFKRNIKPATVNRYFEVLRHLFHLALEDGLIRDNPIRFYKAFTEDRQARALSHEELEKILAAARRIQDEGKTYIHSVIYDLIALSLNTGMRLSEILTLKKSYLNDDTLLIPITETKHRRRGGGQSGGVKIICLNPIANDIITGQRSGGEYVFDLRQREASIIVKTIRKIRKLSGVPDFHFHQLRHTVSTFLSSQVSLATAKVVLGHSDLRTTMRYTHPGLEEQRAAVAKLGDEYRITSAKILKRKGDEQGP